jgi:signal transduction histidine kinase
MIRRILCILVWLVAPLPAGAAGIASTPRSILILNESAMVGPFYTAAYDAFRSTVATKSPQPVSLYLEQLELERFGGDSYENAVKTYFRSKYEGKPVGVVVAFGFAALDFVLRIRKEMWSSVPVAFVMVDDEALRRLNIPPDVTGRTANVKFRDSLVAAKAVVPNLRRIAIVGDQWETQTFYRHFKNEIPADTEGLELIDLIGLPMRELRKRVAILPDRTAIIYTSIFSDGEGTSYPPIDALGLFAEVANRPIVVSAETFVGRGSIGGYVLTPSAAGDDAANLALRLLNGESPSLISIAEGDVVRPVFDWRQLQRWGVSEPQLPKGSEVRFREPTLWQQYRVQILAICTAILVQSIMILWLVYEHWRRRLAEALSRNSMAELAQMNRMATAGELSASIAHEVNQPLAGITTRASAALRWLAAETPDIEKARAALTQIVEAGHRAADVIMSIRAMFKKNTNEKTPTNINSLILTVLAIVRVEMQRKGVELRTQLDGDLPFINGDKVQLQQVLLNLVVNAADAMQPVQRRVLTVLSEKSKADMVRISINDTGIGVDPSNVDRIFKPLFTTKASGMGMGLSICRSIIESHGGRIWVSPGRDCGSTFAIELPTETAKHNVAA